MREARNILGPGILTWLVLMDAGARGRNCEKRPAYQTRQAGAATIGCPILQANAF